MTEENRDENAARELERARTALAAARVLLAGGFWDDAVSRAYYAAFHAATAALYSVGAQARSHRGVHALLFERFIGPGLLSRSVGKDLASLQRYREDADYSTSVRFDEAGAREEVDRAERVLAVIAGLLRR